MLPWGLVLEWERLQENAVKEQAHHYLHEKNRHSSKLSRGDNRADQRSDCCS